MQVDVDRDKLPLGDYMWLVLPQDNHSQTAAAAAGGGRGGRAAAAASGSAGASSEEQGGNEEGNEEEEEAAAAERLQSLVAGAVVERKTVSNPGSVCRKHLGPAVLRFCYLCAARLVLAASSVDVPIIWSLPPPPSLIESTCGKPSDGMRLPPGSCCAGARPRWSLRKARPLASATAHALRRGRRAPPAVHHREHHAAHWALRAVRSDTRYVDGVRGAVATAAEGSRLPKRRPPQ